MMEENAAATETNTEEKKIMEFLIVQIGRIGDMILTTPPFFRF
ncbi:MAG: hypothetical protein AB2L26_04965 [Ignavibacteria bacterium]